jgi:hypothetical protein
MAGEMDTGSYAQFLILTGCARLPSAFEADNCVRYTRPFGSDEIIPGPRAGAHRRQAIRPECLHIENDDGRKAGAGRLSTAKVSAGSPWPGCNADLRSNTAY